MPRYLLPILALANLTAVEPAPKAGLPVTVIAESVSPCWTPSGWMGDTSFITFDAAWKTNPHSGATCTKCEFRKSDGWGGVVWQSPGNDWGDAVGGWNLAGAGKLVVWARGELGGEEVSFSFGLIGADKPWHDTAKDSLKVKLTREWTQYEINVSGKDLSRIKTGFCWIVGRQTATFYLDDVRWE